MEPKMQVSLLFVNGLAARVALQTLPLLSIQVIVPTSQNAA
jgi:hypothetical protein